MVVLDGTDAIGGERGGRAVEELTCRLCVGGGWFGRVLFWWVGAVDVGERRRSLYTSVHGTEAGPRYRLSVLCTRDERIEISKRSGTDLLD